MHFQMCILSDAAELPSKRFNILDATNKEILHLRETGTRQM